MQPLNSGIARNDEIRVVAEPLQAAIPNIAMNIIVGARAHTKKFNVPHGSQDEPNDDNASVEFGRSEKLTDREEICDASKRQ
jgi:hypothetical protein